MKTVLITGASSGIGKACTEKFAEKGYSIIGVGNNKKRLEKLRQFQKELKIAQFYVTILVIKKI